MSDILYTVPARQKVPKTPGRFFVTSGGTTERREFLPVLTDENRGKHRHIERCRRNFVAVERCILNRCLLQREVIMMLNSDQVRRALGILQRLLTNQDTLLNDLYPKDADYSQYIAFVKQHFPSKSHITAAMVKPVTTQNAEVNLWALELPEDNMDSAYLRIVNPYELYNVNRTIVTTKPQNAGVRNRGNGCSNCTDAVTQAVQAVQAENTQLQDENIQLHFELMNTQLNTANAGLGQLQVLPDLMLGDEGTLHNQQTNQTNQTHPLDDFTLTEQDWQEIANAAPPPTEAQNANAALQLLASFGDI
jgi:hypothetical protein